MVTATDLLHGDSLSELNDVTLSSPSDGNFLYFNGTKWTVPTDLTWDNTNGKLEIRELEVKDAGYTQLLVGSTDGSGAALFLDGNANGDGAGGDGAYLIHSGDDSTLRLVNEANSPIEFRTNDTLAVTIAANGEPTFEQRMYAANGNTANPAYSFSTSPGMGAYLFTANHYAISTAGTMRMSINPTGNISMGDNYSTPDSLLHLYEGSAGAVTSPAGTVLTIENNADAILQFLTPNTAIQSIRFGDPELTTAGNFTFNHSSNAFTFVLAGTTALTLTGTDVTSSLPHLFASGSAAAPSITFGSDTDTGSYLPTPGHYAITTSGVEAIRVDGGQDVGIGISNPVEKLDIKGNIRLDNRGTGSFSNSEIQFNSGDSAGVWNGGTFRYEKTASIDRFTFVTGAGDHTYFDNTGSVQVVDTGSATDPAYTFSTDTNSGIYSRAADQIGISTGGLERVFVSTASTTFINPSASSLIVMRRSETNISDNDVIGQIQFEGRDDGNNLHRYATIQATATDITDGTEDATVAVTGSVAGSTDQDLLLIGEKGLKVRSGSATECAYSFLNDPDTGMYRTTTDSLGFAVGGTLALRISGTSQSLAIQDGTASVPSFTFINDSDVGLFRPASNTLAFVTAGVNRGSFDASGNFSIEGGDLLVKTSNPPASAGATGTQGTITWDTGFIYVCTATNTWKRAALSTW